MKDRFQSVAGGRERSCHGRSGGFSLIEVLLVVAIISIIGLATASMIVTQQREVRALSEKLLALETQTQLNHVLFNSDFCNCLFKNQTFDTATKKFAPGLANGIPDGYPPPPPPAPPVPNPCIPTSSLIVPGVGQKFTGRNIEVKTLEVTDVTQQSPGNYVGKIKIELLHDRDTDKLVRELRPIESPIAFQIDTASGVPSARPFLACSGNISGITLSQKVESPVATNRFNAVSCPPGFRLTSCHADVNSGDGMSKQFKQNIQYTGAPGGPITGCNADMQDGADNYKLVAICVK